MWATVSALGDRDTTCAIVGGVLAAGPGTKVPPSWLTVREPLEHMSRARIAGYHDVPNDRA